jgi:hypothetical protein
VSEWDLLLEGLARGLEGGIGDNHSSGHYYADKFEAVLRAKLLPLLEAGQAMRERHMYHEGNQNDAWDAAKEAALKESR